MMTLPSILGSRRDLLGAITAAPLAALPGDARSANDREVAATVAIDHLTPEQFGAVGDGVADDAPAIQRALAAAAARPRAATVILQPRVAYRCGSGLTLDATRVSLWGNALLDFSGWSGRYLRVDASSVGVPGRDAANNYGHRGMISGMIRIVGAGWDTASTGVEFSSGAIATSAQLLIENLSVAHCGIGLRFGSRGYNNVLVRCDVFQCGVCVDWPEADDNGERNTLIGCTLFNSVLAARVTASNAWLHLLSCSLDYTEQLFDVRSGHVLATGCNIESNRWKDRPIRCSGDGGVIRLDGGVMVNQVELTKPTITHFVDVGKGARVEFGAVFASSLPLRAQDPSLPPTWAIGAGEFDVERTQCFELSLLPPRLHAGRTCLSDPDFASERWEDVIWRIADTAGPAGGRLGRPDSNLRLAKGAVAGVRGLIATKAGASGTLAALALITLPVRPGDIVLSGFRVRRDPGRAGRDGTVFVSPSWIRIDGQDDQHVPIVVRQDVIGTQALEPPTDRMLPVWPLHARSQRRAPAWATHFCMVVDLSKADQASFLFNGLWADTI
ncbi:hypothetical protein SAMN06297144_1137 [Sphingomonas guangdongensis]|uniref:Pectate lyase superfamily protein n=1 Tax=Sphingomonas guangdongensis TaxID=1141890 RepID=A0A285QGE7_9SPHN|nr:hypothetical protein [Sphingomonas guangdongensis]SOB80588.1 hypothetical protein SAMN06297144_1137 [Sphingomonas guangdongensis]